MDPSKLILNQEAQILTRVVDAHSGAWSAATAEGILALALAPADRDRMNELAARAREDTLSPDEELEIESYRMATGVLELMQARARVSLRKHGKAA